ESTIRRSEHRRMAARHCVCQAVFVMLSFVPRVHGEEPAAQPAEQATPADQAAAMWKNHVEPILQKNCFRCHGSEKQKGGLDLRTVATILMGGTDGSVVIPGRSDDSPLFLRIQPDA